MCDWVMLTMTLPRRLGHGMMSLVSHARDCHTEAIWLWHCR
jgi:hypothetical protein